MKELTFSKKLIIGMVTTIYLASIVPAGAVYTDTDYDLVATHQVVNATETYTYNWHKNAGQSYVEEFNKNDDIITRSTWDQENRQVVTEIVDSDGQITVRRRNISDILQPVTEEEQSIIEQQILNGTQNNASLRFGLGDEPADDTGLPNSPTYAGYKYIGSNTDFGCTAKLHRHLDSISTENVKFRVVFPDTTIPELAQALCQAYLGLTEDAALTLALWIQETIDLSGYFGYCSYHYTYKINVNDKQAYQHKSCTSRDYWSAVKDGGEYIPGDYRGVTSNHGYISDPSLVLPMAIQSHLNGEPPIDVSCSKADKS